MKRRQLLQVPTKGGTKKWGVVMKSEVSKGTPEMCQFTEPLPSTSLAASIGKGPRCHGPQTRDGVISH